MTTAQATKAEREADHYQFQQIVDDSWIAYSRTTEHMPIVSVRASIGVPCLNPMTTRSYGLTQFIPEEVGAVTIDNFREKPFDMD